MQTSAQPATNRRNVFFSKEEYGERATVGVDTVWFFTKRFFIGYHVTFGLYSREEATRLCYEGLKPASGIQRRLNKNKEDTLAVDIGYSVEKQDKSAKKHSLSKNTECDDEDEREEFVAQKRRKIGTDSIAAPQDANGMEACFDPTGTIANEPLHDKTKPLTAHALTALDSGTTSGPGLTSVSSASSVATALDWSILDGAHDMGIAEMRSLIKKRTKEMASKLLVNKKSVGYLMQQQVNKMGN